MFPATSKEGCRRNTWEVEMAKAKKKSVKKSTKRVVKTVKKAPAKTVTKRKRALKRGPGRPNNSLLSRKTKMSLFYVGMSPALIALYGLEMVDRKLGTEMSKKAGGVFVQYLARPAWDLLCG